MPKSNGKKIKCKWISGVGGLTCPQGCCHIGTKKEARTEVSKYTRRKVKQILKKKDPDAIDRNVL